MKTKQINKQTKTIQESKTAMERFRSWKHFDKFKVGVISVLITYALTIWILIWFHIPDRYMVFSVIPVCFIATVLIGNDFFIFLALYFSLWADVCLQLYQDVTTQAFGAGMFLISQLLIAAFLFIKDKSKAKRITFTVIRAVLMIVTPIILKLIVKDNINAFLIMGSIYIPNIFVNAVEAGCAKCWILFAGLTVFAISDIAVVLLNLLPSSSSAYQKLFKFNLVHLLYIPSQVLIALNNKRLDLKVNRYI